MDTEKLLSQETKDVVVDRITSAMNTESNPDGSIDREKAFSPKMKNKVKAAVLAALREAGVVL